MPAHAQSWKDRLKKAEKKVEGAADPSGTDKAAPAGQPAAATEATPAVNVNYDFTPGARQIFAEDFSGDKVGDLPSRLKALSGNWEIADVGGRKLLRATSFGAIMIPLPQALPDKFTFEADFQHSFGWSVEVYFLPDDARDGHNSVTFGSTGGIAGFTSDAPPDADEHHMYHARVMADGEHVKVYMNGKRVANVPEAKLGRANAIWIEGTADADNPFYIGNIRVAASDKTLFDAISAEGRAVTHGILFDSNSDRLRPESAPTLKEIGDMLKEHADLRLTIEGHTDNVGQAAANLALSQKRADAVKQYLVSTFGIDAGRLSTRGFGDTRPVAPNSTEDGRQQNRRVELVRM